MKKKTIWSNLIFFLSGVLILLAYLLLFFFPALIDINRYRREIKDFQLKMRDEDRTQNMIVYIDRKEKKMLKQTKKDLWKHIPPVEGREAKKILIQRISQQLKNSAEREGIQNLMFVTSSSEMETHRTKTSLAESERNLFTRLIKDKEKEKEQAIFHSGNLTFYKILPEKVSSQRIFLGFSGTLSPATRLIYGLSQSDVYSELEDIRISAGEYYPFFFIIQRLFFRGEEKNSTIPEKRNGNQISTDQTSGDSETGDAFIDLNSPLLLFPVYQTRAFLQKKRELPELSFRNIFIRERR